MGGGVQCYCVRYGNILIIPLYKYWQGRKVELIAVVEFTMMAPIHVLTVCLSLIIAGAIGNPTTIAPQPVYVNKPTEPTPSYVPHATYPYADTFGGSSYGAYLYPTGALQEYAGKDDSTSYMSALLPAAQVSAFAI